MSIQPAHETSLEFDLADRMRKSLRIAGLGIQEMADYLEVSRGAVGSWVNGRNKPQPHAIKLWAMRTGVPVEWLKTGKENPPTQGGGGNLGEPSYLVEPSNLCGISERSNIVPFPPRRELGAAVAA